MGRLRVRLRLRERSFDFPFEPPAPPIPAAGAAGATGAADGDESACLAEASAAGRLGCRDRLAGFGLSVTSGAVSFSVEAALLLSSWGTAGPRRETRPPLRLRELRAGAALSSATSEAESGAVGGFGIPRSLALSRFKGSVIRRPSLPATFQTGPRTLPVDQPAARSGRKTQEEQALRRSSRERQPHRTGAWSAAVSSK